MTDTATAFPRLEASAVPFLTTEQRVEVDRATIEDYRILLIQMMENAGRNLADLARARFLGGKPTGHRVAVLAGVGGNGGGALVCARRLKNYGADVEVFLTRPDPDFTEIPLHQLGIVKRMDVPCAVGAPTQSVDYDLVVDGIIGYSLKGAPRGKAADLIQWANGSGTAILSLDAPSGVDTTTGTAFDPVIRATATMTLALPKEGLRVHDVSQNVGELYLADISVPPELYAEPALHMQVPHLFAKSDIVQLVSP